MEVCPVCDGAGVLLREICPLCDGDPSGGDPSGGTSRADRCSGLANAECEANEEETLFTLDEDGIRVVLPSLASNTFFAAQFTMPGLFPPRFDVSMTLGNCGIVNISGLDVATANRIAAIVTDVPPIFLSPALPPVTALLQILAVAEWQKALITVDEGPHTAAEAVCLFYDEH